MLRRQNSTHGDSGSNGDGRCGYGTTVNILSVSNLPYLPTLSVDFIQISAGGSYTCALSVLGTIFCWGANDKGQLGRGDSTAMIISITSASAIAFDTPTIPAISVFAGGMSPHTCALFTTSQVRCWGSNYRGEIGQEHSRSSVGTDASDMTSISFISFFETTAKVY